MKVKIMSCNIREMIWQNVIYKFFREEKNIKKGHVRDFFGLVQSAEKFEFPFLEPLF